MMQVTGFVAGYMLYENDSDAAWRFAIFEDPRPTTATPTTPRRTSAMWSTERSWKTSPNGMTGRSKPADSHGSNARAAAVTWLHGRGSPWHEQRGRSVAR
jgi:hypothetical protein